MPKEKGGVEFTIIVVDYFSKWVKAVPLKKTRGEDLTHFLWKHILMRFGIPKILVSEIDHSSRGRQARFDEERNDQRLMEVLNFTDDLRDKALYKILKCKQLLARCYNRRVKNRQFLVGDLVLRLFFASHPKEQSKLSPNSEGPYRVGRILCRGTYELEDLDGKPIVRTWHPSKLCKYYV
ncbi:hypothetical protein LIER_39894 [Lithospermum erythrorhizon]|uniref:Integrase catalytic domain-containing protein n=1 Tax=Lithospermum erythrorhizon TaxID=34254 RepID=A0AAV3QLQ4_LITER